MVSLGEELQQVSEKLASRAERPESLKKMEIPRGRPVFNKKIFSTDGSMQSLNQLDLKPPPNIARRVRETITLWTEKDPANFYMLISDHLPVHLHLPVKTYPPDCRLYQVLVLAEGLEFLLLTLYDGDSVDADPDPVLVEQFTVRCTRLLTHQLLNFSGKDFILLSLTLEMKSFNLNSLEQELKRQKHHVADFYSGPLQLNEECYRQLVQAVLILAAASDVPSFFEGPDEAGKKLLVGDPDRDRALRQTISLLTEQKAVGGPPKITDSREMTSVVLEAAKRVSYSQRVIVVSEDPTVKNCVVKLARSAEKECALDPSWFRCLTAQDAEAELNTISSDKSVCEEKLEDSSEEKREDSIEGKREDSSEEKCEDSSEGKLEDSSKGKREDSSKGKREDSSKGKHEDSSKGKREDSSKGKREDSSKGKREDVLIIAVNSPDFPDVPELRLRLEEKISSRFKEGVTQQIRILLVGKSGSGKSSTANSLLGAEKRFATGISFSPVTQSGQTQKRLYDDVSIEVTETPGIFSFAEPFTSACSPYSDGPGDPATPNFDVVCFVVKFGRFTEEEKHVFDRIKLLYGERVLSRMIVIFTFGDIINEQGNTFESLLDTAPGSLQGILEQCGNRYVVFDNTNPTNKGQVNQLLRVVKTLASGQKYYCPGENQLRHRWDEAREMDLELK